MFSWHDAYGATWTLVGPSKASNQYITIFHFKLFSIIFVCLTIVVATLSVLNFVCVKKKKKKNWNKQETVVYALYDDLENYFWKTKGKWNTA
jgi:hypothetical protein